MGLAMDAPLSYLHTPKTTLARFRNDHRAIINLTSILAIIGTLIGAIIVFQIGAAIFPDFAGSVADVNENLSNESVTFGDDATDAIKPVFAFVLGIVALVGFIGILLGAFNRST